MEKPFLAHPEALYLKPLLYGLAGSESPFEHVVDIPAKLALRMSKPQQNERIQLERAGCAFLSPLDYARYGSEYCIVPGVGVSSSEPTGTVQLYVKSDIRNIKTMAVDIRVTSEIILAKIILMEKYPNEESEQTNVQIVPMLPDVNAMLAKADSALVVNFSPAAPQSDAFKLDLVEEWADLTELPYVHGFWVGREGRMSVEDLQRLIRAKMDGAALVGSMAEQEYLSAFSYDFDEPQSESLREFMSYAFYFGILPDVPEVNFYDVEDSPKPNRN